MDARCRRGEAERVELRYPDGFQRGDHEREADRLASCEDGVDGGKLDGRRPPARWQLDDHVLGVIRGRGEHGAHTRLRRRDQREAVPPPTLEGEGEERLGIVVDVDELADQRVNERRRA